MTTAFLRNSFLLSLLIIAPITNANTCVLCSMPLSEESEIEGFADPCEDLYSAACLSKDGSPKFKGKISEMKVEMSNITWNAQTEGAKSLGFTSVEDGAKARLRSAGLDDEIPELKDYYSPSTSTPAELLTNKLIYELGNIRKCAESEDHQTSGNDKSATVRSLEIQLRAQNSKFFELQAMDIPNFVTIEIGTNCSILKDNPGIYPADLNQKMASICSKKPLIDLEAIDLFRLSNDPNQRDTYLKKSQEFVRNYQMPDFVKAPIGDDGSLGSSFKRRPGGESGFGGGLYSPKKIKTTIPESGPSKLEIEESDLRDDIMENCILNAELEARLKAKVIEDYIGEVTRSKATVDSIVGSIYSDENHKKVTAFSGAIREQLSANVAGMEINSKQKKRIIAEYSTLNVSWLSSPPIEIMESNPKGATLIKSERFKEITNREYNAFFDPRLSYFKEPNATYHWNEIHGATRSEEKVVMNPILIKSLDKHPHLFFGVLAHEYAHKLGPGVSKLNEHDLSDQWKELIECYKDPISIALQPNQEDETISDFLSSEMLATQLSASSLDTNSKRRVIYDAVSFFCMTSQDSIDFSSLNCTGVHAVDSLRVSGIIGANPRIRELLGCKQDSKKFKTCGLALKTDTSPRSRGAKRKSGKPGASTR